MHDFSCKKAEDILSPILRERVRVLKETEGGRQEVCQIMEKRIDEEKIELAKKAIETGKYSASEVATLFELPIAFVEELVRNKQPALA